MFRILSFSLLFVSPMLAVAEEVTFSLRYQTESKPGSGNYHRLLREENWNPQETAVIVCDMWDLHHCLNAVRRVEEFGPRLNDFLEKARSQGMTIIHAPSDCMDFYADHPARKRAMQTPQAKEFPADIASWCSRIPSEEQAKYPIDQSDGGEDDDPAEHADWAKKLKEMGRNPGNPWKRQTELIEIDGERDFISDAGKEVWSVLADRGIKNVILTGVHTNMCVLGRPFGLRQMAKNGKNVVLVRDLTDTMYNPARWPFVSHFTGTDLVLSHVEKFVCPTISSDQLIGGKEFRFAKDTRPTVALVIAEDEYETGSTLPKFAAEQLDKEFRTIYFFGSGEERHSIPGLEAVGEADLLLISVRRRGLPPGQMAAVKKFVAEGKPVVGIRTASHAFDLKGEKIERRDQWPEFDATVFGGNYTGHHGKLVPVVTMIEAAQNHPILTGFGKEEFQSGGSLYKTSPLAAEAVPLLTGAIEGQQPEPIAWTFTRKEGGRSFYTSLGHKDDFASPRFNLLLLNAIRWGLKLPAQETSARLNQDSYWRLVSVPGSPEENIEGKSWYRCCVRLPESWLDSAGLTLELPQASARAWFNGNLLSGETERNIQHEWIDIDDANLLVVFLDSGEFNAAPVVHCGKRKISLQGNWQFRAGENQAWSNIPLPARYGASTDIVFEPK